MGQSRSKFPAQSPAERLFYLDNFRTYLTALVIYHHTAIPYGGLGAWFYESRFHKPGTSIPLMAFNINNQTYFMASFFLLSGYFSTRTLERKGAKSFLKTKFMKLGIPTIAYTLLARPAQVALLKAYNGEPLNVDILTIPWKSLRGVRGPVWYCAVVLIFDTIYASLPSNTPPLPQIGLLPNLILDIAANFLIRLIYAPGEIFEPLNLLPGYLPQYIFSYALGASLSTPPTPPITSTSRTILLAASLASTATMLWRFYYHPNSSPFPLARTLSLSNLSYAVWNETTGYLLGTGILGVFKSSAWLNRRWGNVGRYSYAAFLVHPIVCCAVQIWTDEWEGGPVLKTVTLGTAGVLGSWGIGWGLVKIPGVKEFLV